LRNQTHALLVNYIGDVILAKMLVTATESVLALAPWVTLQIIETILSSVMPTGNYRSKLMPFEAHKNIFYI
jgi:hypothetical protein